MIMEKEAGILTYYGVHNHGAVLQANALKNVLTSLGYNTEFLIFERSYEYISEGQAHKYRISLSSIPFYMKYLFQRGAGNIVYNIKKSRTLKKFRKKNFKLNTKYDEFTGNVTVIGSDEVFSLEIGFNPMMYGYGLKSEKKLSYAGSFGPSVIGDVQRLKKTEIIRDGLSAMDAISVRDKNSQAVIKNLIGIEVPIVCDPVILYGYTLEMNSFKPAEKDYIVVYAYDGRMNDEEEIDEICQYARKNKKKLYSVGYYHKWCDKNINASPIKLLGWINNADLVITDTFHGTVMSIICNTPMTVKLRSNANKLKYLLEEYGLGNRIVKSFNELGSVACQNIDFASVNKIITKKRKQSMDYLKKALEE